MLVRLGYLLVRMHQFPTPLIYSMVPRPSTVIPLVLYSLSEVQRVIMVRNTTLSGGIRHDSTGPTHTVHDEDKVSEMG